MEVTSSPKVEGFILRSSRSLYKLCLNLSFWYLQHALSLQTTAEGLWQHMQGSSAVDTAVSRVGKATVIMNKRLLASHCLCVGSQAGQTNVKLVVYLVHLLVVRCQSLKLHAKAEIAANCYAVLACHRDNSCPIILENLQQHRLDISAQYPSG